MDLGSSFRPAQAWAQTWGGKLPHVAGRCQGIYSVKEAILELNWRFFASNADAPEVFSGLTPVT
jgi:hypothetical protein